MLRFLSKYSKELNSVFASKGSFAQNFAITFSGSSAALLLGFIFTPFLARIFTPDTYGYFALYIAITTNLGILSTLQLTRAFILPKSEEEFLELLRTTLVVLITVVLLLLVIVLLFKELVFKAIGGNGFWLYLIPITVLFIAIGDVLRSWNIRLKLFSRNASSQISGSVVPRSTALVIGLLTSAQYGALVVGDFLSKIFESIILLGREKLRKILSLSLNLKIFSTIKYYRNYPSYILPATWLSMLSAQLPIYFFMSYFDATSVGFYSFANSMLNLPVTIMAGAVAPVFLQKASETYNDSPLQMSRIVYELANRLFLVGILPMLVLIVYGDVIFEMVLGDQWIESGRLARYMGLYFLLSVVYVPLTSLFRIYGKERILLLLNLSLVILNSLGLVLGVFLNDIDAAIIFFSISNCVIYLVGIAFAFRLSGVPYARVLARWVAICILGYLLIWASRFFIGI
ncbi:MAG: lipopolysaccharide biosynthesis protein [Cyclobacteriaceae bacterium]